MASNHSMQSLMRALHGAAERGAPTPQGLAGLLALSSGTSLPEPVLRRMSIVLGHDFSGVRIHLDDAAARAAQRVSARAFTIERDIYFNRGEFNPGSPAGEELIAHELVHVRQHDEGRLSSAEGISSPSDPAEREATQVARRAQPELRQLEANTQPIISDLNVWMQAPQPEASQGAGGEAASSDKSTDFTGPAMRSEGVQEAEQGWGETLLQILGHTLAGDFIEDPHMASIVIRTIVGLIPYADQVLDAEDIIACLYKLLWEGRVDDGWVWFALVLTLIGCIPEAGSVIKGVGKGATKIIREAGTRGARSIGLDKLFDLMADGARRLDADGQLQELLRGWRELLDGFDVGVLAELVQGELSKLLATATDRASEFKRMVQLVSEGWASKMDEILVNISRAREAMPKMVDESLAKAKSGVEGIIRLLREEIGVRVVRSRLGEEGFEQLQEELGPDLLRRLSVGLDPTLLQDLSSKLGREGIERLGPDRALRLFGDLKGDAAATVSRLTASQLDGLSRLDPTVLDSLAANTATRRGELLEEVDDLLGASKLDEVYEKYPKGSGNMRQGHALTKHGPQRSDEELFQQSVSEGSVVSRWTSFADMNRLIELERAKLYDVANQVANGSHCLLNKRGMQTLQKAISANPGRSAQELFDELISNSADHPHLFRRKVALEQVDAGEIIGAEFLPDGVTKNTSVQHFTVRFELDSAGKMKLDTAYPESI